MKISGTIQAIAEQYTVGPQKMVLDQAMLSAIQRFATAAGWCKHIGMREKPAHTRGKNAKIYEFDFDDSWQVQRK